MSLSVRRVTSLPIQRSQKLPIPLLVLWRSQITLF